MLGSICSKYGAVALKRVKADGIIRIRSLNAAGLRLKKPQKELLARSRFDYLVCKDDGTPVFALDIGTRCGERSGAAVCLKRAVCEHSGLPYLALFSRYADSQGMRLKLLSWCIELWFEQAEFAYWQSEGILPADKAFDIFESNWESYTAWPRGLFSELDRKLQRLHARTGLESMRVEFRIGAEQDGAYRGIATMEGSDGSGLAVRCAVVTGHAPSLEQDLLKAVLLKHLLKKLKRRGLGRGAAVARSAAWFQAGCEAQSTGVFGWGIQ